jgi:hypothetical protein
MKKYQRNTNTIWVQTGGEQLLEDIAASPHRESLVVDPRRYGERIYAGGYCKSYSEVRRFGKSGGCSESAEGACQGLHGFWRRRKRQ